MGRRASARRIESSSFDRIGVSRIVVVRRNAYSSIVKQSEVSI